MYIYILVLTIDIYVVKQEDSSTSQILLDHMQKKKRSKKKRRKQTYTTYARGYGKAFVCCVTS